MNLSHYYHSLQTDRIKFRKLSYDDLTQWQPFFENNNSLKHLGIDMTRNSEVMAKRWIEVQLQRYEQQAFGHLAMVAKNTDQLIGTQGFKMQNINGEACLIKLSAIKQEHQRKGYGTEGSQCLQDYIFNAGYFSKIIGICHEDNIVSQHYNERLGGVKSGPFLQGQRKVYFFTFYKQ